MLFKLKPTYQEAATWTAGAAVASAIIGGYSAYESSQKKSSVIKQTPAVSQDASISEADDLLRRRQRQGNAANVTGAANTGINSAGQKTLLGG